MKQEENQKAWTMHPRPQMRRKEYKILQDGWELSSRPIRIPYPPQARLSEYDGPVSGIWQQVWLEHVPDLFIEKLEITPSLDSVKISVSCNKAAEHIRVVIALADGKMLEAESADGNFEIGIPNPHLWAPEDPYLYDLTVFAGIGSRL